MTKQKMEWKIRDTQSLWHDCLTANKDLYNKSPPEKYVKVSEGETKLVTTPKADNSSDPLPTITSPDTTHITTLDVNSTQAPAEGKDEIIGVLPDSVDNETNPHPQPGTSLRRVKLGNHTKIHLQPWSNPLLYPIPGPMRIGTWVLEGLMKAYPGKKKAPPPMPKPHELPTQEGHKPHD